MSGPMQGRDVHIDVLLSEIAINYRPEGFIADQIFPTVRVQKQSDKYVIFEQADLFRRENARRARGGEANKIHSRTSSASFYAENYALKADVTLEDRLNADPIFLTQFEQGRVTRVMDALLLDWETRLATLLTTTTNVGTATAIASRWNDYTNSDPLNDVHTIVSNMEGATGYRANHILFSGTAWRHFRRNTAVINKAGGQPGAGPNVSAGGLYPGVKAVEDLLEMKVLVGNAWRNTAEEGIAMALSQIWGDEVVIYYRPEQPAIDRPSAGYFFRWAVPGLPDMTVERHPYDTRKKADEVEVGYYQDEVITAQPLIGLLTNVTSNN